jgi:hypothetical protein
MNIAADNALGSVSPSASFEETSASSLDVRRLLRLLRRDWMMIVLFAAIGVYLGVLYLRGAKYSYPVQMELTTVQATQSGTPSSTLSSLTGLIGVGGGMPSSPSELDFRLFGDSIYTRDIADIIAKNRDIMTAIFADQWDPVTQSWHEPPVTDFQQHILDIRAFLGLAPPAAWQPPDGLNLLNFIRQTVSVQTDPRKPYLVTLVMIYPDTRFSLKFLDLLWRTADNYLRQRALLRAREDIAYLSNQLTRVTVAEHRAALTAALSEEEKFAMTASSNAPFSAEMFERPWASTLPASPVPRQIFMISALLGGALGALVALGTRRLWRSIRSVRIRRVRPATS